MMTPRRRSKAETCTSDAQRKGRSRRRASWTVGNTSARCRLSARCSSGASSISSRNGLVLPMMDHRSAALLGCVGYDPPIGRQQPDLGPGSRPATARNPKIGFGLSPDPGRPGRRRGQVWGPVCRTLQGCVGFDPPIGSILDPGPGMKPQNRVWVISRYRPPRTTPTAGLGTGLQRTTRLCRIRPADRLDLGPGSRPETPK